MSDALTGQVTSEAAELYERFFVPALFAQWPSRLLELASVERGDDVLDVACGTGVLARAAKAEVGPTGTVQGLDVNSGMLAVAARTAPAITWLSGRAEELPVADRTVDRVLCQFGLMFFSDRAAAVREMARVLRPRGRVCVATWSALAESPGYGALVDLIDEMFGSEHAQALAAPFNIGTSGALRDAMSVGFDRVEVHRLEGEARFPSLDGWIETDVRAWTLWDMLDNDQFEQLRVTARTRLSGFCDPTGAVAFPAAALVAVAEA